MKNITLSAQEDLIERGRQVARDRRTTLNHLFRDWLAGLDGADLRAAEHEAIMESTSGKVKVGRKFSREEMNER
ncbi:MAG: hypothetical protein JJU00_14295 [Opitutales bacterium]|nr:hypothetical protein [Opitutales bacterium]